jgi:PAS domain S-box-containing protein
MQGGITLGSEKDDQGTGQGVVEEAFVSENIWRALILLSTAAVLLFSVYCLSHGITTIFMHLYYFPIVLLAYRYRYRGCVLAALLSLAYVGLVVFFEPGPAEVIGALCRLAVFIGIAAVVANLSERLVVVHGALKERLETIQNLHQFQESIIANANIWITVLAPDGTILVWNDTAEAICGYKRGDVLGKRTIWRDLYPEKAYRQKVNRDVRNIIKEERYLETFETKIRCADGTQKTIVWNTRGIRGPDSSIQTYIVIGRDITGQKRAEEALRESKEFLDKIISSIGDPIHVKDRQHRVILINDAACRLFNLSREEIIGKTAYELFPGKEMADISWQKDEEVFRTGRENANEETNTYAPGKTLTVLVRKTLYMDTAGNQFLVGITTDITDRKRAEVALLRANKQLNLLSSITRHDILNQLMALKGYLELSKDAIDNPATLREYITKEEKAADTIEHQITFTKDYQNLGVAAPEWQSVNASIQKALHGLPMRDIHVEVDPKNPEIFADRLFEKVFYNLIDNALRYGGDRMKTIRVSAQESDTSLTIVCEDDGVGIFKEDKKRLFTRGFGRNTGLGLFLSREILAITGITITEDGEPGRGARFRIVVPEGMWRMAGRGA